MANKPVVGTLVTYHNKEKGTTKEYEITGSIPDFLLLKDTETGKGHKLRVGSKIYAEIFGEAQEAQSETEPEKEVEKEVAPEPKKAKKAKVEKPNVEKKDASETVDMSKYVDTEHEDEPEKEVAPEPKKAKVEKPKEKAKAKSQPAPEDTPVFDSVDYDDEGASEPVQAVYFMKVADSKNKLSELMTYISSDDAAVRKLAILYAFAWVNRGKMNIDRVALAEALDSSKRKKSLAEFTNADIKKLGDAILASTDGDWDLDELANLLPKDDDCATIICQLICDGGITDWGHNLKGIKDDVLSTFISIVWEME